MEWRTQWPEYVSNTRKRILKTYIPENRIAVLLKFL
jgi:hypothetical protein